jgi:hypothetical protein
MKKTKTLVFVLLALSALTVQIVLRIWKPEVQTINSCPLCLGVTSILQTVERCTAAEVRPKAARVVYITASQVCDCAQEPCQRGDQVIAQIFAGERQKLLRHIDLSKDAKSADLYVKKLNLVLRVPVLLFVDAQDNILWSTGEVLSKEVILVKLKEFGVN